MVDKLRKYAHFMTLAHPYITLDVAQVFRYSVFKLHGLPESITSDNDPILLVPFGPKISNCMELISISYQLITLSLMDKLRCLISA